MDFTASKNQLAPVYAGIVRENLSQKYPYHVQHLVSGPADNALPQELYPAFHTSYDWHSCVHMHWLGVRLLDHGLPPESETPLRRLLGANLTEANLTVEAEYVRGHATFERPYGWAWAARLAAACQTFDDDDGRRWRAALEPRVEAVYAQALPWAAKIAHPVRHGVHSNTAFGLMLLIDAAGALGRNKEAEDLGRAAVRLFGADRNWAQEWELSGQDFLSAGLSEADLLARVLPAPALQTWLAAFLPGLGAGAPILRPAVVTDPTDAQMVHLDGLNLSRAGALRRISAALRKSGADEEAGRLDSAATELLELGLRAVLTEEFVSSHWLASFAWDALDSSGS
ncbi:DUF2891 family protein [Paenarthrobacter sp. Z7-10]|uniref:DUF2891 family protein n=1 Tax=Paenarthrobacter sp. Z7-10 TaxID=2787635 RepID=UPI0022A9DBC4|nr:DUF2891 family protein [Paenarthrobacter sp. Z7-10]MCZ2401933.1 DUF2891 family protein [Paenarthrobacter sp. Z7-10]